MVSTEFDSFGFSVKNLAMRNIVLRSNSTGNLYPFQSTHGDPIPSSTSSTLSVLSSSIWHSCLGCPGNAVLDFLHSSNSIKYNKNPSFVCHSRPLVKHIRLPFVTSQSVSTRPFEIIHSDVQTSLISSPLGYKYYVFFLDHYNNFLWTFPLFCKSQVYDIFVHFNVFVNTQFELNIKSFQCDHGVNLKIKYFTNFATIRVFNFVFLVLTHLLKMENPKEKFAPFLILFVHFCVMLLSPRIFGFTP